MVKVTDKDYYMDGYLKTNLDAVKTMVGKDWDVVLCVDGPEGAGKSVLALQMAYYFDPTFDCSRVCFTLNEFEEAIYNGKKGQAIVGDEMMRMLNSRSAMSKANKRIIELLAECRQKNLFIILVLPSFFDLDKYAAIHRTTFLVHVYTGNDFKRGFFGFFDFDRKKKLYILGKKMYNHKAVKCNFVGRFYEYYPVIEEEYRRRKRDSLRREREDDQGDTTMRSLRLDSCLYYMYKKLRVAQRTIEKDLGIPHQTTSSAVKRHERRVNKRGGSEFSYPPTS